MKHIKTPVRVSEGNVIEDKDGRRILLVRDGVVDPEGLARLINSYNDLLTTCKSMAYGTSFYRLDHNGCNVCCVCGERAEQYFLIRHSDWCVVGQAYAAIAKTRRESNV